MARASPTVSPEDKREVLLEICRRRGVPVPPELQQWAARREAARRGIFIHKTFRDFVEAENPSLLDYEHTPKIIDVAQRVIDGKLRNVVMMAPPRYLKSEVWSRLFPAYFLRKKKRKQFALASHAASLALELSESARDYYTRSGGELAGETSAKARWQVAGSSSQQGTMWAVGVQGGGALGRGFHMGVVDDPIHPDHAYSWLRRERFKRWWENTWLRSMEPGAQLIFNMQRLHTDDPIDLLFRREVGEGGEVCAPLYWHVVCLDEIYSLEPLGRWSGPKGLPPTCTLEPDWREVGQVLAPSRFSEEEVKERQAQNPIITSAQRQQRPLRATGDFWQKVWFDDRTYEELPETAYNGGWDWDTAQTKNERNSATACVLSYRGPAPKDRPDDFPVYIHDVDFRWVEYPQMLKWMRSVAGPHYVEAKSSGKSAVQSLKVYKIVVSEVQVKGDKLARASRAQPAVSSGRVYVHDRVVQKLLYAEQQGLLRVTAEALSEGGEGLDLNDAFVQALHRHLKLGDDKRFEAVIPRRRA